MVTFQPVQLQDREWAIPLLRKGNMRGCQYCFSTIYAWAEIYNEKFARQGDYILVESGTKERFYLYPCGEGAGYAGGITSAAMDGLRTAEQIIRAYAPLSKN